MKNFLHLVSLAVLSFTATIPVTAQQSLTLQQKKTIEAEVIPVIFDQLKQQTGIDFMEFANPKLNVKSIANSSLFIPQSKLKAEATPAEVKLKPEYVVLKASAINPLLVSMTDNDTIKITFENYQPFTLPVEIGSSNVTIDMPGTIKVNVHKENAWLPLATVYIKNTPESEGSMLGKTVISLDIFGGGETPIITLNVSQDKTTYAVIVDVTLEKTLRELMLAMQVAVPEVNYQISVGLTEYMMKGYLPLSLYGVPTADGAQKMPMGDANIFMDFSKEMPVQAIQVKSYDYAEDGKVTNSYNKLSFSLAQKAENIIITIQDSTSNADWTQNDYDGTTLVTMTDYSLIPASLPSAISLAVERAVKAVQSNANPDYRLLIQTADDLDGNGIIANNEITSNDLQIDVTTAMEATSLKAVANVSIKQKDIEVMQLKASLPLKENTINVELSPVNEGVATQIGSMVFTSNIGGIVTGNETSPVLDEVRIYAQDGGIYVENADKATYSVVNFNGSNIQQGIIAGTNAFIGTSNLAKGSIYILTITKDNAHKSFKFKTK